MWVPFLFRATPQLREPDEMAPSFRSQPRGGRAFARPPAGTRRRYEPTQRRAPSLVLGNLCVRPWRGRSRFVGDQVEWRRRYSACLEIRHGALAERAAADVFACLVW